MRGKLVGTLAAGIMVAALVSNGSAAELSAVKIVEKNVAARGGLDAWRKIDTMVWSGHLTTTHGEVPSMLFVMQQKRPNKTRFDINALGQKTVRIFDGVRGWKVKPNREGGPEITTYSTEEVAFAQAGQVIDGPLIDYVAKGNTVTLEGRDEVRGHKAYRLAVRLPGGEIDHVWIDAKTFLDLRYDRQYSSAMSPATVSVFYGNYKTVQGLQIPSLIETANAPGVAPDKLVIENIMPNGPVDERSFARPGTHEHRRGTPMAAPPAASPNPAAEPK